MSIPRPSGASQHPSLGERHKPPSHPSTRGCGLAPPSVIPTCVAKPSLAGVPVRATEGTVKRYNAQIELISDCDVPGRLNLMYVSQNSMSGLVRSFSVLSCSWPDSRTSIRRTGNKESRVNLRWKLEIHAQWFLAGPWVNTPRSCRDGRRGGVMDEPGGL